jgi:hypothetical protein
VIYILKENRTFDQMLDLDNGANADSSITQFPRAITPSLHGIASQFVTLDRAICPTFRWCASATTIWATSAPPSAAWTRRRREQADDDYAVGLLVQAVANSPYASNTVVIVTEDDCQDGPDHVDSHRATTYSAGAYVKLGAVVSTP